MSLDSLGRVRVAPPVTIFEHFVSIKSGENLDQDIWITDKTGNSTVGYNPFNYVYLKLSTNGDTVIRITKYCLMYKPAKARCIYLTFVPFDRLPTIDEDVEFNIGIARLDTNNQIIEGLYLNTDGKVISIKEVRIDGIEQVIQNNWNMDKFDGLGPSQQTLTVNNLMTNLFLVIDQQWQGIGRVRIGFVIGGILYYAHQFQHLNRSTPYHTTPRFNIFMQLKANIIGTPIECRQICTACTIEGECLIAGAQFSHKTGFAGVTLSLKSVKYILLAFRVKKDSLISLRPLSFNINIPQLMNNYQLNINDTGSTGSNGSKNGKNSENDNTGTNTNLIQPTYIMYELQLHSSVGSVGAISGNLNYTLLPNSLIEVAIGDGSTNKILTDGNIQHSGFSTLSTITESLDYSQCGSNMTRSVATIYDTYYLTITGSISNLLVHGSVMIRDMI